MEEKILIKPLDFANFLNVGWNKFFYKLVAEARQDAEDAALSMGGGEVQKLPLLPGSYTNDQKYMYQFHPNVWKQAIKRRYNEDLVDIGRHWDMHNKLPGEEANKAEEVVFQIPGAKAKPGKPFFRVYTGMDDEAKMYVGAHDLGHKLSNPAKIDPNQHLDNPKFSEGPSLKEIDPKNPEHLENYLKNGAHGLYDFDLSGAVEQSAEYVDKLPDADIVEMLAGHWKKMYDDAPEGPDGHKVLPKELKDEIRKKRTNLKEEPDRTTAGYDVMTKDIANDLIANWVKATSLGLLGQVPEKIKDPLTNQEVQVTKVPYETAVKDFGLDPSVGFDPHKTRIKGGSLDMSKEDKKAFKSEKFAPGKVTNLDVYAFPRKVKYHDTDYQGNIIPGSNKVETILVPFLPDVKVIPKFPLTPEQRAILAHRRRPDLIPRGTPEEMLATYKKIVEAGGQNAKDVEKAGSVSGDVKRGINGIMNNWDLWTPEQINHMQTNARSLPEVAKAMHTLSSEDAYSLPKGFFTLGHSTNKNDIGTPFLGVPKEKMNDFVKKYQPLMAAEAYKAVDRWIKNQEEGKGGALQLPKEVVKTLDNLAPDLITISTYFLMTFLNHRTMGIYDPDTKYGLNLSKDKGVEEAGPDEQGGSKAQQLRRNKVYGILQTLGQITWDGFPGRRARTKYGSYMGSLDQPIGGEEGKSTSLGADVEKKGDVEEMLKAFRYGHDFRRSLRTPTLGQGVARSGWKRTVTESDSELNGFLGTVRNRIRRVLGDEVGDVVDNAEKRLEIGIKTAQALYKHYDEMYKKQYPDDEKRHNLVTAEVAKNLMKQLKAGHQDLYGNMSSQETEELIAKVKNSLTKAGMDYSYSLAQEDPQYKNKSVHAMDQFWTKLIKTGNAIRPLYNKEKQQFQDTGVPISIQMFREPGTNVLSVPGAAFVAKVMRALYPDDVPDEASHGVDQFALGVYKKVLSNFGVKKSDEEAIKELKEAGVRPVEEKQLVQPSVAPQVPAAQPQPQQQMAAKNIGDVLTKLGTFKTSQEFVALVPEILAHKDEIVKNPQLVQTLMQLRPAMQQRSQELANKGDFTPEYLLATAQLRKLLQELLKK